MGLFGDWVVTKIAFPFFKFLYRGLLRSPRARLGPARPGASQGPGFAGRRKSARPAPSPGDPRPPEPRADGLRLPRHRGILGKSAAGTYLFY